VLLLLWEPEWENIRVVKSQEKASPLATWEGNCHKQDPKSSLASIPRYISTLVFI
jgi:hypothetical protein